MTIKLSIKICKHCKKRFKEKNKGQIFCSGKCYDKGVWGKS